MTAARTCYCSAKADIDSVFGCVPVQLYLWELWLFILFSYVMKSSSLSFQLFKKFWSILSSQAVQKQFSDPCLCLLTSFPNAIVLLSLYPVIYPITAEPSFGNVQSSECFDLILTLNHFALATLSCLLLFECTEHTPILELLHMFFTLEHFYPDIKQLTSSLHPWF